MKKTIWNPNEENTITVRQENRHGSHLDMEAVSEYREKMKKNNIAILVVTEGRFSTEEKKYLEMQDHHTFLAEMTQKEIEDKHIKKRHAKALKITGEKKRIDEQLEAEKEINQAKMELKTNPNKFKAHGIAVYIAKAVYPQAKLIVMNGKEARSANHIAIEIADRRGQKLVLIAIYGPPGDYKENNKFYKETITPLVEKHNNTPLIMVGDHNATADPAKDIKIHKNKKGQNKKSELQTLILEQTLTDLRKYYAHEPTIFTFEKKEGDEIKYQANLDYFIANEEWLKEYARKQPKISFDKIPKDKYDHKPLNLTFEQDTIKVKRKRTKTFRRTLTEEQKSQLENALENLDLEQNKGIEKITQLIQEFQKEHLTSEMEENKSTFIEKKYLKAKLAHKTLEKLRWLLSKLEKYEHKVLSEKEILPKAQNESIENRIARLMRRLSEKTPEYYPELNQRKEEWEKQIEEKRKRASTHKRRYARKAKTERIRKYVNDMIEAHTGNPRKFYKKIRMTLNQKTNMIGAVYTKNDQGKIHVSADDETVRNEVADFYAELYRTRGDKRASFEKWLKIRTPTERSVDKAEARITEEEVENTIRNLSNNKATGLDGVPAEIYKLLAKRKSAEPDKMSHLIKMLTRGFNDIKNGTDQIPPSWNKSRMILLHKGGDEYDIANYRPITLIQVIYKIYATILAHRLTDFTEENNFLSHTQTGFRPERGTAQKLLAIKLAILHAKRLNSELHIISIDIKKAFDSVEHWIIESTLGENGLNVPPTLVAAIMATLKNTTIQIQTEAGLTREVDIQRGVRQGDPLSAILFDIAIDPLLQAMTERTTGTTPTEGPQAFADDVEIVAYTANKAEAYWDIVQEYCKDTGLELSEKKTQYIRNEIAYQNKSKAKLKHINGEEISELPLNNPFKVLGVWFTTNGDWKYHKDRTKGIIIGQIYTLIKKKITPMQLLTVINTIQIPALAYGMAVVNYTEEEIRKMIKMITSILRKKFRFQGPTGWEDWFTLNTKDFGGLNLANVRDKYHSAQITAFQTAILDYDSPAKRELKRLERELNESSSFKQPITMPENTVWDEIIYILQKRRSTIHTTLPSKQNQQNLEEILTKAQKQREFEKLLKIINKSNSHVTAEQLYDAIIDQHTVEINSTAQIHEKIARLEKGDIISEEARLYEPEATHTISEISRKIRGKNREKPITMPVFENIGGRETRYSTVEYQGETWEINFTDGSAKNKIAAWGAYIPIGGKLKIPENKENLEIKQTQMFYGRVEGEQTNIRAELQAILTVLSRKETTKKNQMIVLDSEYSEKEIKAWKSKTKKKRRLTENRDMMKQIQNKIDFIENGANGPRIIFVHVYSHQKEAGTHSDPKRKEKIEKQKEEFGNDKLYQILVNGNEIADKLAEKGRRSTEHQRDWALEPTQGNDKFYVITDDIINDKKPQIWIKEQTQSDTYIKRTEQKHNENSRNDYLHYLPICNRALSFQAGKIRNHKQHHIYLVLARIRFHAAPTLKILSKQISQREWTDPFRTYYKEMYPTPNCHFCEKKNVKIEEDTTHMLNCPNRNSRNEVAEELWNQIWEMIEKKQQNDDPKKWETRKKKRDIKNQNRGRKRKEERGNDSKKKRGKNKKNDEEEEEEENLLNPAAHLQKPNPRLLRPFAMRTEGTLASHEAAVAARGGIPLPRSLEGLAAFPDGAAGYALIPESLCRALRELWVLAEDAHSLAAEIAQSVQKAVVREYHMRCRTIAEERDAKGKFAHHVLGK